MFQQQYVPRWSLGHKQNWITAHSNALLLYFTNNISLWPEFCLSAFIFPLYSKVPLLHHLFCPFLLDGNRRIPHYHAVSPCDICAVLLWYRMEFVCLLFSRFLQFSIEWSLALRCIKIQFSLLSICLYPRSVPGGAGCVLVRYVVNRWWFTGATWRLSITIILQWHYHQESGNEQLINYATSKTL